MPMLPEEKARVKIDKQLRNAGWDIVARNEYLPNSIDGTAIRIQFKISGLSKIKDILTEINEEGNPCRISSACLQGRHSGHVPADAYGRR